MGEEFLLNTQLVKCIFMLSYVTFDLIYDLKARIFKIPHGVDIYCS